MLYFLELADGSLRPLPAVKNDADAVTYANSFGDTYCLNQVGDVVVKIEPKNYIVLCPGGPGGEQYTWCPKEQVDAG